MFFGLRSYQLEGARFLLSQKRGALWFSMGLGKSLTCLAAASHDRQQMLPILVLAPKRVCQVWQEEVAKWNFKFSTAVVAGTRKKKLKILAEPVPDITIANFHSLSLLAERCNSVRGIPWQTVIIDESSLLKSPKSKRWKLAKQLCDRVDRVITLTGSPCSSGAAGPQDIWGQVALMCRNGTNPLGTHSNFLSRWFRFDHFNRPVARKGAEEKIAKLIAPMVLRHDLDEIEMPQMIRLIERVEWSKEAQAAHDEAAMQEVGFVRMRTIASGFTIDHRWDGDTTINWVHEAKLERLAEIIELTREHLIVYVNFQAEADAIANRFGGVVIDGRTASAAAGQFIESWNARKLPLLVCNVASAGHGLNLQDGGRRMVFFSNPVSYEQRSQAEARLWRSGQKHPVVCHDLVTTGSIDEPIMKLLDKKEISEKRVMEEVKNARRTK